MRELPKKTSHTEFTKGEFLEFLSRFDDPGSEEQNTAEILYFKSISPHPAGSDLIYWPPEHVKTDDDIVKEIERYCRDNGLPGFKDSGF